MKSAITDENLQISPDYHAFLLRLWRVVPGSQPATADPGWRATLERVDTGELTGFIELQALFEYLSQVCVPLQGTTSVEGELHPMPHTSSTKEAKMYVQINTTRVAADSTEEFVQALSTEKLGLLMSSAKGVVHSFLIQSIEDPQVFASLSLWESREEGQAFFSSPEYIAVVGGVAELLVEGLNRQGYEVRVKY